MNLFFHFLQKNIIVMLFKLEYLNLNKRKYFDIKISTHYKIKNFKLTNNFVNLDIVIVRIVHQNRYVFTILTY